MSELNVLVQGLAAAIQAGDSAGFQSLSTPAGWESRGDSAQRLWHQATKKKWLLVAVDTKIVENRAATQVILKQPDKTSTSRAHLLSIRGDDGWLLEGLNNSTAFVAAFLEGKVPALLSGRDLAGDPSADAWAKAAMGDFAAALKGLERADSYLPRLSAPGITPTYIESKYLEAVGRALVKYELTEAGNEYPESMTVLIEKSDAGWTPLKVMDRGGIELLLS